MSKLINGYSWHTLRARASEHLRGVESIGFELAALLAGGVADWSPGEQSYAEESLALMRECISAAAWVWDEEGGGDAALAYAWDWWERLRDAVAASEAAGAWVAPAADGPADHSAQYCFTWRGGDALTEGEGGLLLGGVPVNNAPKVRAWRAELRSGAVAYGGGR